MVWVDVVSITPSSWMGTGRHVTQAGRVRGVHVNWMHGTTCEAQDHMWGTGGSSSWGSHALLSGVVLKGVDA